MQKNHNSKIEKKLSLVFFVIQGRRIASPHPQKNTKKQFGDQTGKIKLSANFVFEFSSENWTTKTLFLFLDEVWKWKATKARNPINLTSLTKSHLFMPNTDTFFFKVIKKKTWHFSHLPVIYRLTPPLWGGGGGVKKIQIWKNCEEGDYDPHLLQKLLTALRANIFTIDSLNCQHNVKQWKASHLA